MTPASRAADESTRVRRAQDPADSPPSVRVAQAEPGEPCASDAPDTDAQGGKTPHPVPAPGHPGGAQTPAGGVGASPASPAALQGAEWRKAVRDAQAKNRRKTTRTTSKRPAQTIDLPPASPGTAPLIATASCAGCAWTAGPGSMADVDRAANKHVARGHSTAVSAELGGAA